MANRPSYSGYKRAQPSSGGYRGAVESGEETKSSRSVSQDTAPVVNNYSSSSPLIANHNSHATPTPTTQVPNHKPLTNEDFQSMIPKHFLKGGQSQGDGEGVTPTPAVNVSVNHPPSSHPPMGLDLPPPPTKLGTVTESITKSTLTETTVTRVTDNQLADMPLITEVGCVRETFRTLLKTPFTLDGTILEVLSSLCRFSSFHLLTRLDSASLFNLYVNEFVAVAWPDAAACI